MKSIKAVIRVSCLVFRENQLAELGVALPANSGGPVNLAFVCDTDLASRDMRNGSSLLMLTCISHHPTVEAHDERP